MTNPAAPRVVPGDLPPGLPVAIEYGRLGAEAVTYRQRLVDSSPNGIVTLQASTPILSPKRIDGRVVLEPGSPVVWFTFADAWHDIGAFHLVDGTFTGLYANVLTPVALSPPGGGEWRWQTTDLCLDVWSADGRVWILDEDELDAALDDGSVDAALATKARIEAARIADAARNDEWPPAVVGEWPLERARSVLRESPP